MDHELRLFPQTALSIVKSELLNSTFEEKENPKQCSDKTLNITSFMITERIPSADEDSVMWLKALEPFSICVNKYIYFSFYLIYSFVFLTVRLDPPSWKLLFVSETSTSGSSHCQYFKC